MLNLSNNRIGHKIDQKKYQSFGMLLNYKSQVIFRRVTGTAFVVLALALFLPWTQNISAPGNLTTLKPGQRPQTIHSVIAGRIDSWYVQEGDTVQKGDTILFLSEIKDDYFDPNLLGRTEEQIKAKELSVSSYMDKIKALDAQIDAMNGAKILKLQQARNYIKQARLKVKADSIEVQLAENNLTIAADQYKRGEQLHEQGLKSLTDLQGRKVKLQEAEAKLYNSEAKLLTSRNQLINARVEVKSIENEYRDKISKAESEKFSAMSNMYDAEAVVTKMQNQYMNYSVRRGLYYVTAPQSGYVTRVLKNGIGETVKEGEEMLTIMPIDYDLAVAMYVKPVDLTLIQKGNRVQLTFDGWPSIVFSGWPQITTGTFTGRVTAIDNFIGEDGKFRILVAEDPNEVPWPHELRVGSGARGIALLKKVPVWYELWRKFNGFPPDYYKEGGFQKQDKKK